MRFSEILNQIRLKLACQQLRSLTIDSMNNLIAQFANGKMTLENYLRKMKILGVLGDIADWFEPV